MSRLDDLVPGWRTLALPAFRARLRDLPGRLRAALREEYDATPPAAPPAPPPAPPPPAPARRRVATAPASAAPAAATPQTQPPPEEG